MNPSSRLASIAFLVVTLGVCGPARAQQSAAPSAPAASSKSAPGREAAPPPAATFVFVPYDKLAGPELGPGKSVLLPYAEFLKLKGAATPDALKAYPAIASISSSVFKGAVEGDVARLDAEFALEALARPEDTLEIQLPFAGASVESASVAGPEATLAPLSGEAGLRAILRGAGRRTVKLRLAAPLTAAGAAKRLDFRVPRAAASSLALTVGEAVTLEPDAQSLPATVSPAENGGVTIEASCGSQDRLLLIYRPRAEATGAAAQTRLTVNQDYRLSVSASGANVRARLDFAVLAGSAQTVTLQVPPSLRLLAVTGSFVKDWSAPDSAGQVVVTLARAVTQPFDLTLDAQLDFTPAAAAAAPLASFVVPELRVPGAARETGTVVISPEVGLAVWPEESAGLEAAPATAKDGAAARAFRFAQPGWRLALSGRPIPARVRADGIILYEVTDDFVRLKSRHRLAIGGRGIFDVVFQVPAGYELREAGPPELVSGFRQEGARVTVMLRGEQRASCEVSLSMQRPRPASENQIRLEPIAIAHGGLEDPPSVAAADMVALEDAGGLALAAPLALRATELETAGLEAADVGAFLQRLQPLLGGELELALGYRYFTPAFHSLVAIERRRTRLTCETARLASLSPSLMRVDTTLDYNVEFSATDEFQLLLPASAGEDVRFSGGDIKEKVRAKPDANAAPDALTTWTIRLQRRVLGPYRLSVSFDAPLPEAKPGAALSVAVPVVRATNVARETGFVAVSRGENLEARVAQSEGLEPRDVKELPATLSSAFLGFRYFDPDKQTLAIELVRHEMESVLGALIRRMHIETVLSDQRQAVHEVYFEIQNNRQQYLELDLPAGMEIWSAFVRGVPVRPTIRQSDGARLIELTKSEAMDKAFRVRLIAKETLPGGAMGRWGRLAFQPPSPQTIPVLRATWKIYLPPAYRYVSFGGTMRLEEGGHMPWVEPAAELLLTDLPAGMAGGIARATLEPPRSQPPVKYEAGETEEEKRARLQGAALEIPIVREGAQYQFSKLSGVGTIETHYWKPKPLLLLQGAWAVLLFALVGGAMVARRRLGVGAAAVVVSLIAASLTDGLTGRLMATAFASTAAVFALGLVVYAMNRTRHAAARLATASGVVAPLQGAASTDQDQPPTPSTSAGL